MEGKESAPKTCGLPIYEEAKLERRKERKEEFLFVV